MSNYHYQVGGSLTTNAPSYVERKADRQLYESLKAGEFCYVLNSRQMGKSSLLVRTRHRLEAEGFKCTTIDMTSIGSETITPAQWYKGIVAEFLRGFKLLGKVNLKAWWQEREDISYLQRLSQFILEVLLETFPEERLFIFVDEIDSILSLDFPIDDFFALIRFCFNERANNSAYRRLTFAIFGVATPSDLIADKQRTPFNIGTAIELGGFELERVRPLARGLTVKEGDSRVVLREILAWTGGQPFLTQKLCQLVVNSSRDAVAGALSIPPGNEAFWVESVVRKFVIRKWQSQDEPEHLRTIRDRIERNEQRAARLLGIYQKLLGGEEVETDDSREQVELILSGLAVKQHGLLRVKNRIYEEVFNLEWVDKQLGKLRPYSETLKVWVASKQTDKSRLLRGQALQDALLWSQGKSLSDVDYQFLKASQDLDKQEMQICLEAERTKEVEARLAVQRLFLGAVSAALVVVTGLGALSFWQYRRAVESERHARISEIRALASSAEDLFARNQRLDALVEAIRAKRKLQNVGEADIETKSRVETALRRTVYEAVEFNQLLGHTAGVWGVAFAPNGQTLASASADSRVKLWGRDGRLLQTLEGHTAAVSGIAFAPDSQTLASASTDRMVKLWSRDGRLLQTLEGHTATVYGIAFAPNGQTLASASADSTVKLWSRDGRLLQTLEGHTATVYGVAFAPNGQTLASASVDSTVKLWSRDGRLLQTLEGHTAEVYGVAFAPDGQTLATASADRTVKLWSRDGRLLQTLEGHTATVWEIAFAPDGQTLASASTDSMVKLWSRDGRLLQTLKGHPSLVYGVAFAPNSQTLATASADITVKLWSRNGHLLKTLVGHTAGVREVAFAPNGQTLVTASADKTVKLWSRGGRLLQTLEGHTATVWGIAFAPDGQTLATASADKTVKLWSRGGRLLQTLEGHTAAVAGVAFAPDGQTLASASEDSTVKLWSRDGRLLQTLEGHTATVMGVVFAPDGQTLASASIDSTVKLWSRDGHLLQTLKGHTAIVWGIAFAPDGQTLATASLDKTVKLWSHDGRWLQTLEGHTAGVEVVTFAPDGQTLASASIDNTVKLWNLERILNLDKLAYACDWVRDYLRTNVELEQEDRKLCDGVGSDTQLH